MTRKDKGAMPIELLTNHTQMRWVLQGIFNIYVAFSDIWITPSTTSDGSRATNTSSIYSMTRGVLLLFSYKISSRMIPERLLFLGADLAAAHFLVHRGAAIKFVGDETWYRKDKKKVRFSLIIGIIFAPGLQSAGEEGARPVY